MIRRIGLTIAVLAFLAIGYATPDGSRDAALYTGDGPGDFTTIQAAVDAIFSHDMPRAIYVDARKTFTETVNLRR